MIPTTRKILIADDHPIVLEALVQTVGKAEPLIETLQAASFQAALVIARSHRPLALAILDYAMPGMNGFIGLDRFKGEFPETPVAICSGFDDASTVQGALERGAIGFLPKSLGREAMIHAIRLMLAGETFLPSLAAGTRGAADANGSGDGPGRDLGMVGRQYGLSHRELELLAALTEGLPNKIIADRLGVAEITVKMHLRSIYRKLGVQSRTAALVKVLGQPH